MPSNIRSDFWLETDSPPTVHSGLMPRDVLPRYLKDFAGIKHPATDDEVNKQLITRAHHLVYFCDRRQNSITQAYKRARRTSSQINKQIKQKSNNLKHSKKLNKNFVDKISDD